MDFNNLMSHYRDFVDENYQIFQIDSKVNLKIMLSVSMLFSY